MEFSFELTNEAFKQKLIQVYPKLENACFVFMKADKINKLVELNPGGSCFRCYTPESIFYSDRGQGRLYIRKIAEAEVNRDYCMVGECVRFLCTVICLCQTYRDYFKTGNLSKANNVETKY